MEKYIIQVNQVFDFLLSSLEKYATQMVVCTIALGLAMVPVTWW